VIAATVVVTTAAGVGLAWLRVRSDSLLAPMLAHLATNSVTFALAWVAHD
jgi:membrane protease YdiL (CAAX protease family)